MTLLSDAARSAALSALRDILAVERSLHGEASLCNAAGNPEDASLLLDLGDSLGEIFDTHVKQLGDI